VPTDGPAPGLAQTFGPGAGDQVHVGEVHQAKNGVSSSAACLMKPFARSATLSSQVTILAELAVVQPAFFSSAATVGDRR